MFQTKLKFGFIGLISSMFLGCGNNSSDSIENCVEYIPVQQREGKNWSFIGPKGNLIAEDEFREMPSAVVNGFFSVMEGTSFSLYNIKDLKNEVLSGLTSVGVFNEDLIPVTPQNERITIVDKKGKTKFTLDPIDGKEITTCNPYFNDGLLSIMTEEKKWGFVDKGGNIKISPKYQYVCNFNEGVALVYKEGKDDSSPSICLIDKEGQELFSFKEEYIPFYQTFREGLLPVIDTEKEICGFFNKKGEFTKVNKKVDGIGTYNSKIFAFSSNTEEDSDGLWGVMDMTGETIIKAKYSWTCILKDGNILAVQWNDEKERGDYYMFDSKGEKLFEFDEYNVVPIMGSQFNFFAKSGKKYVLLNSKGKQVSDVEFAEINNYFIPDIFVKSDFFNPEAFVDALTAELTNGAYGRYSIGMSASSLGITNYEDYAWSSVYHDNQLNKQGWGYTSEITILTNEPIARRESSSDSFYNVRYTVVKNPSAKIESIVISFLTEKPCWNKIKQKLIEQIQSKGYTLTKSNDSVYEFSGKNCVLNLIGSDSENNIQITISAKDSTPTVIETEADVDPAQYDEFMDW